MTLAPQLVMAASLGIVPTLPHAHQGESSRLLKDDEPLESVRLDEVEFTSSEGADFVPRLKKRVVWTYGVGETGVWASHVIIGFYLNTFLLEVAGVNASYVRIAIYFLLALYCMLKHFSILRATISG